MKNIITLVLLSMVFVVVSCSSGSEKPTEKKAEKTPEVKSVLETAQKFFATLPTEAINKNNPLNESKIALGKALYHDNRLSKDQTQSCNTCHPISTYGVDNNPTSAGDNGGFGNRNSPTTFNAALHISQFWDGRNADVEEQAGGPILNPVEMAMPSEAAVIKRIKEVPEYVELFAAAFPDDEKPMTYKNLTYAIGAFERTLLTPSAFDKYIAGDETAISEQAKLGLSDFIETGCTQCHSGALLGGNMLMKFGLFADYWEHTKSPIIDSGKYHVTGAAADMYIFKVPSLRNIDKTGPYFHDGSVKSLEDAIQIMAKTQNNKELSIDQVKNIEVFLSTLTGEIPNRALIN